MTILTKSPATPPSLASPPEQGQWTYADWLRLPNDGYRYEILNGELFMSPPPAIEHQDVSGSLFALMWLYAKQKNLGKVFEAPTGVRLPNEPVPVQPDIFFIRQERLAMIGKEYIEGAPDLIVEILSPSNWTYDRKEKFEIYQRAGVSEYWIIDYRAKTVEVFILETGAYVLINKFGSGASVRSTNLSGFEIKVDDLFAN